MIALPLANAAFAITTITALASSAETFGRQYFQLHYDYEVAAQCGLISGTVEQVFRDRRQVGDTNGLLSDVARRQLRLNAYVAAAREYNNRGLGGYKQWCRGAATLGVRRILSPQNR